MSCHDDLQLPPPGLVNSFLFLVSVVHTAQWYGIKAGWEPRYRWTLQS